MGKGFDRASLWQRLKTGVAPLRMTQRFLLAYVCLAMIPLLLFIAWYSYSSILEEQKAEVQEKQTALEQTTALLESRMEQTVLSHQLLQSNAALLNLLTSNYYSVSDEVFSYSQQIYPVFTSILSKSAIDEIVVYAAPSLQLSYLRMAPYISDIGDFPFGEAVLEQLQLQNAYWLLSTTGGVPKLICLQNLYNRSYSRVVGVLEIQMELKKVFQDVSFLQEGETLFLQWEDRYYSLTAQNGSIQLGEGVSTDGLAASMGKRPSLSAPLQNTSFSLDYFYRFEQSVTSSTLHTLAFVIPFLIIPSFFFWFYVNRFTSKLQKLSQHIRSSRKTSLSPYPSPEGSDEFGVVVSEYNKLVHSVERLTESVRQAEKLKSDATYYALASQIQPHFLFNTLENIRMHIEIEDTDSAKSMLFALGCFLRYNISMQQESTLLREVEHVRNYLLIYQYRQKSKISFQISLPSQVEDVPCPFCILQPIVENCLHHGQIGGTPLHIQVSVRQEDLKTWVEVADNGRGMTEEELSLLNQKLAAAWPPQPEKPAPVPAEGPQEEKAGGVGLANVNSRLKYFYGPSSGLVFRRNIPHGMVCILVLGGTPQGRKEKEAC